MKRSIRLIIGVGAVAILLVVLIALQNREQQPQQPQASTLPGSSDDRVTFHQVDRDLVRRITVENPDGELLLLPGDPSDGGSASRFSVAYEYDVEFVGQDVSRIVTSATRLTSRRVIGEVDDLSAYGLSEPQATVSIETADDTRRIRIGSQTPAQDAYYVQVDGDPQVYSVFRTAINPFFSTVDSLRLRVVPAIQSETLRRVSVTNLEGERIRVRRRLDTEVDPELTFAGLVTVEPYESTFQTNTNWLEETVLATYAAVQIGTYVDDDPQDLSTYGLDPPRARVALADESTAVEILIGEQAGGGRYAKFSDQPSVFVVSGIGPIIRSRPYETISPFALILNIDLIDQFVVETPDQRFVGSIERTEVAGEEDPQETFFLNGEPISDELFRDLYQWAIGLQLDAEGGTVTSGTPVATISYQFADASPSRSVSFYPQNANFLSVVRNGRTEFVISRAKVERMIAAFEQAAAEL